MRQVTNEVKTKNTKKIESKITHKNILKQNLCFKKILIQKKNDSKFKNETQTKELRISIKSDDIHLYSEKKFDIYHENNFEISDTSQHIEPNEIKLLIDKMCKNIFMNNDKCKFTVNNGIFSDAIFEIIKKNNHAHIKVSNIQEIAKSQLQKNKNLLKTKLRSKEINFDDFEFL